MSDSDQRLLVTTALEGTWGKDENLLFAGEWCKTHDQRYTWQERNYEMVEFHWDDRNKLKDDYDYLDGLHQTLLHSLADSLNTLHKVNYSLRYWQILLDPWLMAYVGVLFDRWETLRLVFETKKSIVTVLPKNSKSEKVPFSYAEFFQQTQSDEWNYLLFSQIIESQYSDKCLTHENDFIIQGKEKSPAIHARSYGVVLKKASIFVDNFLGRLSSHYKVVFLSSGFNLTSLAILSLSIKQVPRLFLKDFKFFDVEKETTLEALDRKTISLDFGPKNQFESFLKETIIDDLPVSILEGFNSLSSRASSLNIQTRSIVTAGDHWNGVFAKFWFADQVNKGVKLVILEHGGSLPAYKELFNFEEDISDVRGTWFLPYHIKHIKIPPTKLTRRSYVGIFKGMRPTRKFCSCIGNEQPKWVCRAHFYPMSAQCLTSFDWVVSLFDALDDDVRKNFRVKPYPNVGWNTKAMYENALGNNYVASNGGLKEVYLASRIIICTYPETTFSEAMATGIPTILVYPEQYYERHPITHDLLNLMRSAKIVFHHPGAAAEHLNSIWSNPDVWWNSPEVLSARIEFSRQAIGTEKNWLTEWKAFVSAVID